MSDNRNDMSVLASQRADAMLPGLQAELTRGVRRRKARSRAAASCAIVVITGGAILAASLSIRSRPLAPALPPVAEAPAEPSIPPVEAASLIEVVRTVSAPSIEIVRDTRPGALIAVYTSPIADLASIRVSDTEFLEILNEIGRPSGLVRANGKVWLTAAVTDEEIEKQRGG